MIAPIAPVGMAPLAGAQPIDLATSAPAGGGFAAMLRSTIGGVENKIAVADDMVRRFAFGESIPLHQVTYALEEARLSVELAMQFRSRLVESYRELLNMQL